MSSTTHAYYYTGDILILTKHRCFFGLDSFDDLSPGSILFILDGDDTRYWVFSPEFGVGRLMIGSGYGLEKL